MDDRLKSIIGHFERAKNKAKRLLPKVKNEYLKGFREAEIITNHKIVKKLKALLSEIETTRKFVKNNELEG